MGNNTISLKARLQNKYAPKTEWDNYSKNQFTPLKGEVCYGLDDNAKINCYKIGDGITDFIDLPWMYNLELVAETIEQNNFTFSIDNGLTPIISSDALIYGFTKLTTIPELELNKEYSVNISIPLIDEETLETFTQETNDTVTWIEVPELSGAKALYSEDSGNIVIVQGLTSIGPQFSSFIGKVDDEGNPMYDDNNNIILDDSSWLGLIYASSITGPYSTITINDIITGETIFTSSNEAVLTLQSDWQEENESALSYIKNKPFGETIEEYNLDLWSNELSMEGEHFPGSVQKYIINGNECSVVEAYPLRSGEYYNNPGLVVPETKFNLKVQGEEILEVFPAIYDFTFKNIPAQVVAFGNKALAEKFLQTEYGPIATFKNSEVLSDEKNFAIMFVMLGSYLNSAVVSLLQDKYELDVDDRGKYCIYCDVQLASRNKITKLDSKYIDTSTVQSNVFEYNPNNPAFIKNNFGTGISLQIPESEDESGKVTATLQRIQIRPTKDRFSSYVPASFYDYLELARRFPGTLVKFTIGNNEPIILHSYCIKNGSEEDVLSFGNFNIVKDWLVDYFNGFNLLTGEVGNDEPVYIEIGSDFDTMHFYPGSGFDINTTNMSASMTCTMQILTAPFLTNSLSYHSISNLPPKLGDLNVESKGVELNGSSANGIYGVAGGYGAKADGDYSTSFGKDNEVYGKGAFAVGSNNIVNHDYAAAIGRQNTTTRRGQVLLGEYANPSEDSVLAVGAFDETIGMSGTGYNVLDLSDKGDLNIIGNMHTEGEYYKNFENDAKYQDCLKREELKNPNYPAKLTFATNEKIRTYYIFKGRNIWSWENDLDFGGLDITLHEKTGLISFTKPEGVSINTVYDMPFDLVQSIPLTLSLYGPLTDYEANQDITITWGTETITMGNNVTQITNNTRFTINMPAESSGTVAFAVQLEIGEIAHPYLPPAEREEYEVPLVNEILVDLSTANPDSSVVLSSVDLSLFPSKIHWTQQLPAIQEHLDWENINNKLFDSKASNIDYIIDYNDSPVYVNTDMALFKLKNFSYVDYNQTLGEGPSIQYMITIDNTEYGPYILDQDNKIGTEEINLSFIDIGTTDAEQLKIEKGLYWIIKSQPHDLSLNPKIEVKTLGTPTSLIPLTIVPIDKRNINPRNFSLIGTPTLQQLSQVQVYLDGIIYNNLTWQKIDLKGYGWVLMAGNLSIFSDINNGAFNFKDTFEPYMCLYDPRGEFVLAFKDSSVEHIAAVDYIPTKEIITKLPTAYIDTPYTINTNGLVNFPQGDILLDNISLTDILDSGFASITSSIVNSDYNSNDPDSLTYIKNRPFYENIIGTTTLSEIIIPASTDHIIYMTRATKNNSTTITSKDDIFYGEMYIADSIATDYFNNKYKIAIKQIFQARTKDAESTGTSTSSDPIVTASGYWKSNGEDVYLGNLYLASLNDKDKTNEDYLYYFNSINNVLQCYYSPDLNINSHTSAANFDDVLQNNGVTTEITVIEQLTAESKTLDIKYLPSTITTKNPNGKLYANDIIINQGQIIDDNGIVIGINTLSLLEKIAELEARLAVLEGV